MAESYREGMNGGVIRVRDGAYIPPDPRNGDWRDFQEWLAAGNVLQEDKTLPRSLHMKAGTVPKT